MLTPGHRDELHRSGLTDETIGAAGLYSTRDARDLVGWSGPALVFPYSTHNGSAAYTRVKLDKPDKAGKHYRSPAGQPNRLYIPSLLDRAILADSATPLWLTEGEKKALKACQEGLACLALPGVWSWKTRDYRDQSIPIADLDLVTWRGRTVYLVFDSDLAVKRSVRLAEWALAEELRRRGARVLAIRLPDGPNGAKVGLDDYLLDHSVETLCALEPVAILDPATTAGEPVHVRHGDEHAVSWPLHGVTLTVSGLREHSDGVTAEVAVTLGGAEVHWSKLNLASTASREALGRKLATHAPRIPWPTIVERTCRRCVEVSRAGNPAVVVVPRVRTGARYLIDPLAPISETTVMAGDGGVGKGLLSLSLALAVCSEARLPGGLCAGLRGPVLYLDWESTEADLAERAHRLAAGLGCAVHDLHYKPMVAPLVAELGAVKAEVSRLGAVAVVVDSLAPASGPEPEGADAAVRTMSALRALGPATRLVVAHVSRATAEGSGPASPFGSVFIRNLARSVWELRRSDDGDGDDLLLGLYHRKVNDGRLQPPIALRLAFGDAFTLTAADLAAHTDLLARVPLPQRLIKTLAAGARTAGDLADLVSGEENSVLKALARLAAKRRVVKLTETKPYLWGLPVR